MRPRRHLRREGYGDAELLRIHVEIAELQICIHAFLEADAICVPVNEEEICCVVWTVTPANVSGRRAAGVPIAVGCEHRNAQVHAGLTCEQVVPAPALLRVAAIYTVLVDIVADSERVSIEPG